MRKFATFIVFGVIAAHSQALLAQAAGPASKSIENAVSHVESQPKSEATSAATNQVEGSGVTHAENPSSLSEERSLPSADEVPAIKSLNDGEAPKAPVESATPPVPSAQPLPHAAAPASRKSLSPAQAAKDSGGTSKDEHRNTAKPKPTAIDVKLSPEQTHAIIEIRKKAESELEKRLAEELKLARADMNAAMVDATSAAEVRKKFDLVQKKYLDLQKVKFEKTLKIREVLSVEQRKKLQTRSNSH